MLPAKRISAHPGRILLREFLEPSGITQAQLARDLGISQNRLNELIRGKRGITAETALLLSGYFRNSAEFWMHLQAAHELTKARHELRRPVRNRRSRARVSESA
jgi:addiction module HigA family antidote